MKLTHQQKTFKEMDMGLRWSMLLAFWLVHTEFFPGAYSGAAVMRWQLGLTTVAYLIYLGFELAFVLLPAGHPLKGRWGAFMNPYLTAAIDIGFFSAMAMLSALLGPLLMALYLYLSLMCTLRSERANALTIGTISAIALAVVLGVKEAPVVDLLSSTVVLWLFSSIIYAIDNTLTQFYIRNTHALDELAQKNTLLERSARIDFLTNLHNHRTFYDWLSQLTQEHIPMSLILMDIDNFKKINDTYGHIAGDYVLREVAQCIRSSLRECDLAARYGGEEFAVLLPRTEPMTAWQIAERIRHTVANHRFVIDKMPLKVTLSGGVGTSRSTLEPHQQTHFVNAVDQQLYQAKTSGKNRIHLELSEDGIQADLHHMGKVLEQIQERLAQSEFNHLHTAVALPPLVTPKTSQLPALQQDRFTLQEQCLIQEMMGQLIQFAHRPGALCTLLDGGFRDCSRQGAHNVRTALYAIHFGIHARLSASEIYVLGLSGLLHDFGKVYISSAILDKPEKLLPEEFMEIQKHPASGYLMIAQEQWIPWQVKKAILNHHERLDGRGYPQGHTRLRLNRNDRILAICDVFDAMTSARPYKPTTPPREALSLIAKEERERLDQKLLTTFHQMIDIALIGEAHAPFNG